MEISTVMSGAEYAVTKQRNADFNKTIEAGRAPGGNMGKDEFLRILVTQLQNQDPTAPMQDKEFIAQMAQFSSLEQITNMSASFQKLSGLLASSEASQVLGRTVEVETGLEGFAPVIGTVDQVLRGDYPQVMVNGEFYDFSQVSKILD